MAIRIPHSSHSIQVLSLHTIEHEIKALGAPSVPGLSRVGRGIEKGRGVRRKKPVFSRGEAALADLADLFGRDASSVIRMSPRLLPTTRIAAVIGARTRHSLRLRRPSPGWYLLSNARLGSRRNISGVAEAAQSTSNGACDSKQAGEELGVKEEVVSRDLGRMLCKVEELQRQRIQKTLEPRKEEVQLSEDERTTYGLSCRASTSKMPCWGDVRFRRRSPAFSSLRAPSLESDSSDHATCRPLIDSGFLFNHPLCKIPVLNRVLTDVKAVYNGSTSSSESRRCS
jgi:hypothetical protein